MVEHTEFLEELLQILSEEDDTKSPEEIMAEVVSIVDDYKSELTLEEAEKEERDNLSMMGIESNPSSEENDEVDESNSRTIIKPINRAFLLDKAQKEYYKKLGISEDEAVDFSPSEKSKHRKKITELFNKMVIAEQEKPEEPSKYASGPFKKIPGNVSVTRKISELEEDTEEDEDEVTPAELKWKRQQTKELRANIKSLTVEIEELKRQNKIKKISPAIINRNNERIAELEDSLEEIEEQKSQYK